MFLGRVASTIVRMAPGMGRLSTVRPVSVHLGGIQPRSSVATIPFMGGRKANAVMTRYMSTDSLEKKPGPGDFESMEEYLLSIDTTVPESKREHVDKLKKQIRGGHLSKRSLYREVPSQEELESIKSTGNFLPRIAPNAEELIDWALSHIPERAGPRRSRRAKRMALKWKIKRENDARRKKENVAALARKQARMKMHREKANHYRELGTQLRGEWSAEAVATSEKE